MDLNKITEKSQAALAEAQASATRRYADTFPPACFSLPNKPAKRA